MNEIELDSKNQGMRNMKTMKRDELNKELIISLKDCIESMQKICEKVIDASGQVGICDDYSSEYYKKCTVKAVDRRIYGALRGSFISLGLIKGHYQCIVDCLEDTEKGEKFHFQQGSRRY